MSEPGAKYDDGKLDWYTLPFVVLKPLVDVFMFGVKKYGIFNCLKNFTDPDRRFFSAAMRHSVECQMDPLSMDEESGCYHEAQAAWNHLLRLYHARKREGIL